MQCSLCHNDILVMVDYIHIIIYLVIMSYFLEEFGKKVKGYRELQGLSQEKLSELVNVSRNTIGLWETGKSFIEYPTLVKLSKVLKIDEAEFFNFPTQKGSSYLEQIVSISAKLPPAKQKQILDIIKTFSV